MGELNSLKKRQEKMLIEKDPTREHNLQNTIESVKNYLQKDDLEKALLMTKEFLTDFDSCLIYSDHESYMDKMKSEFQNVFDEFHNDVKCNNCGSNTNINVKDNIWLRLGSLCENCKIIEKNKLVEKRYNEDMKRIGVPIRYLNARIEDFPVKYHYLTQSNSGIYLHGTCGVGKTHLMAALIRNDIINAKPVEKSTGYNPYRNLNAGPEYNYPCFLTVPELLYKLRSIYDKSLDCSEHALIEAYTNRDVLYLDDLGVEKASEWVLEKLFFIIDRRYKNNLKTVYSSNYSLSKLSYRLDDRIASRIAGMCDVIEMKGPDRRIQE